MQLFELQATFSRTHCDCPQCTACCEFMPGALAPGDAEAIAEHLDRDLTSEFLTEYFEASEGATVGAYDQQTGELHTFNIPSIVPKLTTMGCVFLQAGRCQIHGASPFGCSRLDTHMEEEESLERAKALCMAQAAAWREQEAYSQQWQILEQAGCVATPLKERKTKLRAASLRIEKLEYGQK